MPDQDLYPVSITEPWPRQRNRWVITTLVLGFALTVGTCWLDFHRLAPVQQFYVPAYIRTNMEWLTGKDATFDFLVMSIRGEQHFALPGDVEPDSTEAGGFVLTQHAVGDGATALRKIRREHILTTKVHALLRHDMYRDKPFLTVFPFTTVILLGVVPIGLIVGSGADYAFRRRLLRGIVRRGPRLVDRYSFNRARKSDGIGFKTAEPVTWRERLDWRYPSTLRGKIAIPRHSENSHVVLMGASGTGKSILLRQFLREIQLRGEAAIVHDPTGEFTAEFFREARGDTILNPLDARSPFWTPVDELSSNSEALTLAESLFPDTQIENQFFVRAPRKIFAHLLQYAPDPEDLAYWLSMPDEIDKRIAGTEMAHMLNKAAGAQRAGVLSSLGMIADSLRLLPIKTEATGNGGTAPRWSARQWAESRQGWIFLTSSATTRTPLRPLHSMWLDTLVLRLMKISPQRVTRPAWLVLDELAGLQKLPQLETALTEARKYQIKIVLGFQGQSQIQERYGDKGAETILGQAATKIYLRANEPNAAEWISKALGDQDVERVRETRSLQEGLQSRNQQSYARELKNERAATAAQILGLPDRHGYIKQENVIARFVLPIVRTEYHVAAFVEREHTKFTPLTLPGDTAPSENATGGSSARNPSDPPSDNPQRQHADDPADPGEEQKPATAELSSLQAGGTSLPSLAGATTVTPEAATPFTSDFD